MQSQSSQPESWIVVAAWLLTFVTMCVIATHTQLQSPFESARELWVSDSPQNWVWAFSLLPIPLLATVNAQRFRLAVSCSFFALGLVVLLWPFVQHVGSAGAVAYTAIRASAYGATKACALAGLIVLAFQARSSPRGIERWLICVMFTTYLAMDAFSLTGTYAARPQTLDEFTYAFDAALGFNPAWQLFHSFSLHRAFAALCNIGYDAIMVAPFALYVIQTRYGDTRTVPSLRAFLIAAILGMVCYVIFPISGPLFFFGSDAYLAHPIASTSPRAIYFLDTWRNGMPSLHLAFALLAAINVPFGLRWLRRAFFAFAGVTTVAALANGQHYFVDMVAALPFVCAVQTLCLYISQPRDLLLLRRFGISALVFSSFLLLLAFMPEWAREPKFAWLLVLAIVTYSIFELRVLGSGPPFRTRLGSQDQDPDNLPLVDERRHGI